MQRIKAVVRATGSFVPEHEVDNEAFQLRLPAEHAGFAAEMEAKTGIERRFYAPSDWATSDLALKASQQALQRGGVGVEDIDLIVLGSDSPDYITPATSVVLQHKLGAKNAGTFDVGCACASFPTALATASGLMATNPSLKKVLVVGAYMMSRLAPPDDPMSFFYGDGAGAALLESRSDLGADDGVLGAAFYADGSYAPQWAILSGGTKEPASELSVKEGRTQVRVYKNYPPQLNNEGWPALARRLSETNDITLDEVDRYIFTQVRRSTIEGAMDSLGQPHSKAEFIMNRFGYTGSACIPMALHEAVISGRAKSGDLVMLVGSGVGLNQAGIALRLTDDLVGA